MKPYIIHITKISATNGFPILGILVVLICIGAFTQSGAAVSSERREFISRYGNIHHWQLKAWKDNEILCDIFLDHPGDPTGNEMQLFCGSETYDEYLTAPPCTTVLTSGDTKKCGGSFLVYIGEYEREYSEVVLLPGVDGGYVIERCELGTWCSKIPKIKFFGTEPLEDYKITEVHVRTGGVDYACTNSESCSYEMPITPVNGIWLEYWAESSFGDESPHQTIHLRNLYRNQGGEKYLLEMLSPETTKNYAALVWDTFPDASHTDATLYSLVDQENQLSTRNHFYYLSGKLIFTGKVNAEGCDRNGLLENGNANACGEEKAYNKVVAWQNQYDSLIYQAGKEHAIPPRIIKGIIAQESQFWGDTGIEFEYGLGCLSEKGVDVLLSWDTAYFLKMCIASFGEDTCEMGYGNLDSEQKAYLRGLSLRAIGTDQEIDLIARVVKADSTQMGQLITNITGKSPGQVSSYEDMWDFSIANFHAGAGCISSGIETLVDNNQPVTFENFCKLNVDCPTACTFVDKVKEYSK